MPTASPLSAASTKGVLVAYGALAGAPPAAELGSAMELAMSGEPAAVEEYLELSRRALEALLAGAGSATEARPPLRLLEISALEAPFSPWVRRYGKDEGAVLFWVARLREVLEGRAPLALPKGRDREAPAAFDAERFVAEGLERLTAPVSPSAGATGLGRIKSIFDLSTTELGKLFGVTRQAAAAWLESGIPADRQAKLQTLLNLAELLSRRLEPSRIAGAVRRPAPAFDDRSILEAIAAGHEAELLEKTRMLFDWSSAA